MGVVALLIGVIVPLILAYFVIRLAVRHGMRDALRERDDRFPAVPPGAPPSQK